jgi:insulysin
MKSFAFNFIVSTLALFFLTSCFSNPKKTLDRIPTSIQNNALNFQEVKKPGETHARLLLPNGLEVLLISSPSIQKSSAAMAVPVGSWADPEDSLGLAHFLEHMLFLGTKDFPDVGEFSNYLKNNSGYMNAYTAKELTNYMLDVNPDALEGALHRFSQFFISPTLDPKYSEREKNAVHSEYDKNIRSDGWRLMSVLGQISPPNHPLRKFNIGSLKTLSTVTPEKLRDFYEKHYSADTMKLVVMSKHPISTIKETVEKYFTNVPNRNLKGQLAIAPPPENWAGGQIIEMKSLESKNQLLITFPVPSFNPHWKEKPDLLLNKILGSKAKGSLLSQLKKMQLATTLSVSNFDMVDYGSNTSLVIFEIELTDKGGKLKSQVVAQALNYLAKIKEVGYQNYTFEENKTMQQLAYNNKPIKDGSRIASGYAKSMLSNPALEIDERATLIYDENKDLFKNYLEKLNPKMMSLIYINHNVKGNLKDPFYGTEYNLYDFNYAHQKKFKDAYKPTGDAYHYPLQNPYIPTQFELYKNETQTAPSLISSTGGQLWFLQETSNNTKPFGYLHLRVISPTANKSAKDALLNSLFAEAIAYSATEALDLLSAANFNVNINAASFGLDIKMKGYSQSFATAARTLLASNENIINNLNLSKEDFESIKQSLQRQIESTEQEPAYLALLTDAANFRNTNSYRLKDFKEEIKNVSLADLNNFIKQFYQKIAFQGLVYGNLKKQELQDLTQKIAEQTKSSFLSPEEAKLALGKEYVLDDYKKFNYQTSGLNNNNAFALFADTGLLTPERYVLSEIVGNLVSADYYTELRTKQQLGYIVQGGFTAKASKDVTRLMFLIQSANHPAEVLQKKSDEFLYSFLQKVDAVIDANLTASISSLVTQWKSRPTDMDGKFNDLSYLMTERNVNWKFYEQLITEAQELKPEQVKDFARLNLNPSTQSRISLIYNANGAPKPSPATGEISIQTKKDFLMQVKFAP